MSNQKLLSFFSFATKKLSKIPITHSESWKKRKYFLIRFSKCEWNSFVALASQNSFEKKHPIISFDILGAKIPGKVFEKKSEKFKKKNYFHSNSIGIYRYDLCFWRKKNFSLYAKSKDNIVSVYVFEIDFRKKTKIFTQ